MQQKSNVFGRPLKYTAALCDEFYVYIVEGYSFNGACEMAGIHRATGWRWRQRYLLTPALFFQGSRSIVHK